MIHHFNYIFENFVKLARQVIGQQTQSGVFFLHNNYTDLELSSLTFFKVTVLKDLFAQLLGQWVYKLYFYIEFFDQKNDNLYTQSWFMSQGFLESCCLPVPASTTYL